MVCGVRLYSANKGAECNSYTDCQVKLADGSTISGRYADCACTYEATGTAVCGPMNGDSEFDTYRSAFVSYYGKTKYCHATRGFDYECGAPKAYYGL